MLNQEDIVKILENSGKKRGYGRLLLTGDGLFGEMGGKSIASPTYLALWELNGKRHFLGRTPLAVSFGRDNSEEIKNALVLVRNTTKVKRAYIIPSAEAFIPPKTPEELDIFESSDCITNQSEEPAFFLLATFNGADAMTGFYFFSGKNLPIPIYSFSLKGNPPMSELMDFFLLLFTVLTQGMEQQERYLEFLCTILEEDDR